MTRTPASARHSNVPIIRRFAARASSVYVQANQQLGFGDYSPEKLASAILSQENVGSQSCLCLLISLIYHLYMTSIDLDLFVLALAQSGLGTTYDLKSKAGLYCR